MRTYLMAICFIIGNIALPQLCHLMQQGGAIFLPIYFFTLIASYKYGFKVGVITAILSPVVNYLLFAMPPAGMLPVIVIKSLLLAASAALIAYRLKKISIFALLLVVLSYQIVGGVAEWLLLGDIYIALQDFRVGLPGMAIQVIGGYFVIKYLITK